MGGRLGIKGENIGRLSEVARHTVFASLFAVVLVFPVAGHGWVETWKYVLWLPLAASSTYLVLRRGFELRSYLWLLILFAQVFILSLLRGESQPVGLRLLIGMALLFGAFCGQAQVFSRKVLHALGWAGFLSTVLQLAYFRWESRPVLSVGDPNYSGLILLLYFFFSYRVRFWPGVVLSIACVFFFLSRNYLLALLVFGAVEVVRWRWAGMLERLAKMQVVGLFGVAVAGTILVSLLFLGGRGVGGEMLPGTKGDVSRFYTLKDDSNQFRFEANLKFLESLQAEPRKAVIGWGQAYFSRYLEGAKVLPHNSFFEMIGRWGLTFTVTFLLLVPIAFRATWSVPNFAAWCAFFAFASFLHSAFLAKYFVFFLAILSIAVPAADESGTGFGSARGDA